MTRVRSRRGEKSSLIEADFLSRRRFLQLGGAGMLAGLLTLFGVAGCGSGHGNDNSAGKDKNNDSNDKENDKRGGEDKGKDND